MDTEKIKSSNLLSKNQKWARNFDSSLLYDLKENIQNIIILQ